jgi:hypothetical protein
MSQICRYVEPPEEVRSHPDWPVKRKSNAEVIRVAKIDVPVVRHPHLSNMVRFRTAEVDFMFTYPLLGGMRVKSLFSRWGWPLDWAGETINLTCGGA